MKAEILRDFFEGRVLARALDADLRGAFKQSTLDSFQLQMTDLDRDFVVRPEHLIKLCDAVLESHLDPEALRAVGFGIIASDHFDWDTDAPHGAVVADTLYDWASPEANYPLSTSNVAKFRHRLVTGEDTFTRADAMRGLKRRRDGWSSGAPPA